MKQKGRLFFIASWLVLRLRWSLAFLRIPASPATLERLWSQPGIILFSRQHGQFPLERWCFDEELSAYLYSSHSAEPGGRSLLRVYHLPDISQN
jgi:hypothetical protein